MIPKSARSYRSSRNAVVNERPLLAHIAVSSRLSPLPLSRKDTRAIVEAHDEIRPKGRLVLDVLSGVNKWRRRLRGTGRRSLVAHLAKIGEAQYLESAAVREDGSSQP